jgi:muramoyltetrapeptide carboxypeptidase
MITYLPKSLTKNSTIGLICPAGGLETDKPVKLAIAYLKKLGYRVKLGKSLIISNKAYKYLSGTDKDRLNDLYNFWSDKSLDAVFCLRGGYGCLRLLDLIDFDRIKKHKKILLGFSDITILLLAFYKMCNLVTFHGPLLTYKFIDKKLKPIDLNTEKYLWKLLTDPQFKFSYSNKSQGIVIKAGKTKGKLLGGNLTDICSMIGSGYLPDFKNSILLLEDCYEEPYKIDRLITQLSNAGVFDQVKGIIFSSFYKCGFKNKTEVIDLLKNKTSRYRVPVIYNFPVGHDTKNYTLPIGLNVYIDARKCILSSSLL